jgi:hypothetical protein
MLGKKRPANELDPPPVASDPAAREVLRVWAAPNHPQQLTLLTTWSDPGAWGLLLADVARHAAKAYANEGRDEAALLQRILELLSDELSSPTDEPLDIS